MNKINKEAIFDAKIEPLMAEVLRICHEHQIAMLATFAIPTPDNPHQAAHSVTPDETGKHPEYIQVLKNVLFLAEGMADAAKKHDAFAAIGVTRPQAGEPGKRKRVH
jgi:hypothetical protein